MSQVAAQLGRLGGLKGARVTNAQLTPEERSEKARKGARARWDRVRRRREEVEEAARAAAAKKSKKPARKRAGK